MNIVTGGLGFIGNELVRQLLKAGEQVVIIDNRNRVAPDIEDLKDVPVYELDICDFKGVLKCFQEVKPKTVYHMAAIHFIPECNQDPERTLRINVEGTQSILRAAVEANVEKFVFASSGAVYADLNEPLTENSTVAPVDIYGWSKLFGEQLCTWFASNTSIKIVAARLFNNFGPRETNFHILPEIIEQLRKSDTLQLGNIKPQRDYIHTEDTSQSLIRLSKSCYAPFQVVNVCSGYSCSVEELIDIIKHTTQRPIVYQKDEARFRKVDKLVQIGDNSLLKQLTNWAPEHNVESGMRNLLVYEKIID